MDVAEAPAHGCGQRESTHGRGVTRMDTVRGAWIGASLLIATLAGPALASGTGTSSVTVEWTAPGDDGYQGEAARYDLRYSLTPISPQNFDVATPAPLVPAPAPAGTRQSTKVVGLEPNRVYYFALKSVDDSGNWSLLSNVAYKTAPDPTRAPSQFSVALSPPYPSPARNNIRFELTLPREANVQVYVMDIGGRLVQWLAAGHYPAGTSVLQWNLITEKGARLDVGQYWLRGILGESSFTHRLTVMP